MRKFTAVALATASLLPFAAPAFGQEASEETASDSDIVVTGTLIRGTTSAVGSQTISVDSTAIAAKGAGSTNELLGLIPQISNTFNGRFETDPRGIGANISINRPNLRNMPGLTSSSGGLTLVLMDGFRMTPVGVNQSAVDVDIIPAAVLAGVDAVTDGGSSLYGADAVAGVLNFVLCGNSRASRSMAILASARRSRAFNSGTPRSSLVRAGRAAMLMFR